MRSNETQDQPPLAKASLMCSGSVEVMWKLRIGAASGWRHRLVRWSGNATKQDHRRCVRGENNRGDDAEKEVWSRCL